MLANPVNREILRRLPELGVEQAYLTAGCLFQAVWNHRGGAAPDAHVRDYDVFYFDGRDLSYEAEDAVIRRARILFAGLDAIIEIKNQARVHLWFGKRFGVAGVPLRSSQDGISRFPVECTCVGIEAGTNALYAPFGLDDLWQGRLRRNSKAPDPASFQAKAASYQARWPFSTVVNGAVTN
jgi:hypothetical protein